ncbi:MAG TPA: efflux RND transporter periplasmic adaptor subunit [Thermoanaerobaculia bacterium]|nr:efflux RND transporter periplasmic adaptor subunit [Thermoanaerobaculia bacterium]
MASDKTAIDGLRIDRGAEEATESRRGLWIGLAVAVVVIAAGLWLWLGRSRAAEVRVAEAVAVSGGTTAGAVLNASGYVTARRQATVSSKVTGKVIEVLVEEGMAVQEGQVLARLDPSTPERTLAFTQAERASARQALDETRVRLREAELNLRRTRRLAEEKVVSEAEVDAAEAEADSLRARLDVGREQVTVADRAVALRRQDLEDTVIRAPFTGVAVSKDAQPGEMISPVSAGGGFTRTGICTLVDMSSLEIEVDVNEAYIGRVRPGQPAEAVLDAYPEWRIPARVIITVPAADRQKATVKVRLGFERLDPRILPDMGVKVAFLGEGREEVAAAGKPAVRVPREALRGDPANPAVLVLDGETVERRAVRIGPAPGEQVEVLAGLAAGERVVVEGPVELADGDRVKVRGQEGR